MNNLKYVIPTVPGYEKAVDILENSLINCGVDITNIIYVYGKSKQFGIYTNKKQQTCVNVITNFYEFNNILGTFILLSKNKDYENYNFLLLHDTCKALKGFKEKSEFICDDMNTHKYDIYWAQKQGRHNIGMFSPKAIKILMKNCIAPLFTKKFDKTYALKMEWDLVPESLHFQPELKQVFTNHHTLLPEYTRSTLFAQHNNPRKIAYFMSLNLIKFFIFLGPIHETIGHFHPHSV